jgi:hypothetical protein
MNNLGVALQVAGDDAAALKLYADGLAVAESDLRPGELPSRDVVNLYVNVAWAQKRLGRPDLAWAPYVAATSTLLRRYGDRRASGSTEMVLAARRLDRGIFLDQVAVGWAWAHQP